MWLRKIGWFGIFRGGDPLFFGGVVFDGKISFCRGFVAIFGFLDFFWEKACGKLEVCYYDNGALFFVVGATEEWSEIWWGAEKN